MKPASAKPASGHHRCLYLSATGRQCRTWVVEPRSMCCPRHAEAQPHGPDDFSLHLLNRACNFENAAGIHESTRCLYTLLAAGAISPRRAAVLGYLTSLLLRTLPAVYNDPLPLAGTPMSAAQLAAQLAEREKAKSLPATESKSHLSLPDENPTPQEAPPAQQSASKLASGHPQMPATPHKAVVPNKVVERPSAQPASQPPVHPAPSTVDASADDYLRCGPGLRPLPATRAEFAAQVLRAVASNPRTPSATLPIPPKPNPPATNPAIDPTVIDPATATIQTPKDPVNQPPEKKKYRVRIHPVMPVTGSEPQWGWTTDP